MQAAASEGRVAETTEQLREILAEGGPDRSLVTAVLGRHLAQD